MNVQTEWSTTAIYNVLLAKDTSASLAERFLVIRRLVFCNSNLIKRCLTWDLTVCSFSFSVSVPRLLKKLKDHGFRRKLRLQTLAPNHSFDVFWRILGFLTNGCFLQSIGPLVWDACGIRGLTRSNRHAPFVTVNTQDGGMNFARELLNSYFRNVSLAALRKARCVMELFEGLRRRNVGVNGNKEARKEKEDRKSDLLTHRGGTSPEPGTYWLTRIVFLRSLGFIYCKSFKSKVQKLCFLSPAFSSLRT